MPRTIRDALGEHDRYIDNLVGGYTRELSSISAAAQSRLISVLQERLTITDGVIARTAANRAILRRVDRLFEAAMDRAGYGLLVEEFATGFNGQLPFFSDVLEILSANLDQPLRVQWKPTDLSAFEAQQIGAVDALTAVVEGAASDAKRKALMNVNALSFTDLVDEIGATFGRTTSESAMLAETSSAMFFRTVTDRGFKQIEQGLPKGALRYRFEGPNDKLTRPWCKHTLARTKAEPLTREQIEALDNGSLPNPWISGGGFRCRHAWILDEIKG